MTAKCVVVNVHLLLLQNMIKHDSGRSKHPLPARGRPRQRCCALGSQASPRVSMRRIFSSLLSQPIALNRFKVLNAWACCAFDNVLSSQRAQHASPKGQRAVHARAVNDRQSPKMGPGKDFQKKNGHRRFNGLTQEQKYCDGSKSKNGPHA